MNQKTCQLLFALLRSVILDKKLTENELKCYSKEVIKDLMIISSKHDVAHLLAFGLKQNGLISKDDSDIEKCIFKAVYRYEHLQYEYDELCNSLEKAKIHFLPLKGSVIRKYYPEPWMRTSCDIDVLVHKKDSEKAKSILVNECGYTFEKGGSHDLSLFSPSGIHVELHYDLVEEGRANSSSIILNDIWNNLNIRDGFCFLNEMSDDMFYFYHIAHMAKHFENGGCGLRPFIDLFILDNLQGINLEKRNELLVKGNLLKFANVARKLSRIWFGNEEYDLISKQMEDYILNGGVYGNSENRIMIQQQKKGGRIKYVFSKIFIPYDDIKFMYPILQKYKILTPVMEVRRWFKLIFRQYKRVLSELRYNQKITKEEAEDTKRFLENVGLSINNQDV